MLEMITRYSYIILLFAKIAECTMFDYRGRPIENVFGGLNKYLAERTRSKEPGVNFKIAQDLYDSDSEGDSKFLLAQRLFLSMKDINDENICNSDSFNALYHVDMALSQQTKNKLNKRIPSGRIQSIYLNLVDKLIKRCYTRYLKTLRNKLQNSMDRERINYVKTFFDQAIDNYMNLRRLEKSSIFHLRKQVGKSTIEKLYEIINGDISIEEINNRDYIKKKLQEVSESESDLDVLSRSYKINSNEDNCQVLYDKFIGEPCKYYKEELGDEVFEPAEFAHQFLSNLDLKNPNFYRYWVYYKLCSVINIDGEPFCGS